MKEINLEYVYTLEEAVTGSVELMKSKRIGLNPYVAVCFGCLIFISNVVVLLRDGQCSEILLVLGPIIALSPLTIRWLIKRNARKIPSINNTFRWHITDTTLTSSTTGSEGYFAWEKLIKIHERKNGFLLFTQPQVAHWLPKHAFQNDRDIELFREIAKSNSIEYKG